MVSVMKKTRKGTGNSYPVPTIEWQNP